MVEEKGRIEQMMRQQVAGERSKHNARMGMVTAGGEAVGTRTS